MTENSDKPVALEQCSDPNCELSGPHYYCLRRPTSAGQSEIADELEAFMDSHPDPQVQELPLLRRVLAALRATRCAGQSEETVERAAKAIHAAHMETKGQLSAWTWEEASKDFYNRLARAALSALNSSAGQSEKAVQDAARRVLHDKVYREARKRHMNDATQQGYDHHSVIVAAEHGARIALSALDLPTIQREARGEALEEALKDVLASLVAAHSLLSRSPKTAAASDKMFDQMLADYAASIERARATLKEGTGE